MPLTVFAVAWLGLRGLMVAWGYDLRAGEPARA
jgi:hypothetical protein